MAEYYYVTKYALTKGILKVPRDEVEIVNKKYLSTPTGALGWRLFVSKGHWFETEAEAREKVKKMVKSRIASLKKTQRRMEEFKPDILELQRF